MEWKIDWENKHSIQNWIVDLNLHCEPKYIIGMLGFAALAGILVGTIIINPLGDMWGRALIYKISMGL